MKSLLASRIFWTQVLAILASLLAVYGIDLPPELQNEIIQAIVTIAGLVTIGLRLVTNKAVTIFKKD